MTAPIRHRTYERFPTRAYLSRLLAERGWATVAEMGVPSYVHRNPLARWFAWRKLAVAARLMGGEARGAVLDFGCGAGTMLRALTEIAETVYAADADVSVAQQVCADHQLDRVKFLQLPQDLDRLAAGSLDLVLALEVLEHVERLDEVVAHFDGWLHAGGSLVVSLPTENWLYRLGRRLAGFGGEYHRRGARPVREALAQRFRERRTVRIPPLVPLYEVIVYGKRG